MPFHFMKMHWPAVSLVLVLLLALLLRLFLSPLAIHGDLLSQAGWGWWIYHNGIFRFYDNNVWIYGWPSHPPLISAVYGLGFLTHQWLNTLLVAIGRFIALHHFGANHILWYYQFTNWFGIAMVPNLPYKYGELISLKLFPIIADLVVAAVIYFAAKKQTNQWLALIFTALYLFLPFSWYESALWGQNDQISFLVLLASVYLLYRQNVLFAPLLYLVSVGMKPTTLIFLPLLLMLCWKNRAHWQQLLCGFGLTILASVITWRLFSNHSFIQFYQQVAFAVFNKGEIFQWYNAFNFWHIFTGQFTSSTNHLLFLSFSSWGWLLFLVFTAAILCVIKYNSWRDLLFALFAITFAAFLFQPRIHERYLYTAVVTGLWLSIRDRRLLFYWCIVMIIYTINLYNGWWFPPFLDPLHKLLDWRHGTLGTWLSVANLVLFFVMSLRIKPLAEMRKQAALWRQNLLAKY